MFICLVNFADDTNINFSLLNAGKITYSFNVMLTDFWNGLMCSNSNLIYPGIYIIIHFNLKLINIQLPPLVVLKILDLLTFQGA